MKRSAKERIGLSGKDGPPKALVENLGEFVDREVLLEGWLYNSRSSGKIAFLLLRDGSGTVQCVTAKADVGEEIFAVARQATQESSIRITGMVKKDDRAPGGYEIMVSNVEIVQIAEEYPITPKSHGTSFLMDHRHLWLRSARPHAILRIRSTVIHGLRDFFADRGFTNIDAPIFTPAACEGTSTLFETDYFDSKAYLTQSGQLYMEAAALAFGRVYSFGPTFRAEKSKTRRHLTEFWMLEPEMAWADLDDAMALAESMIVAVIDRVLDTHMQDLETLERDLSKLERIQKPFPRITYDEALAILEKKGKTIEWGEDFGGEDETVLAEEFDRPVFIHRWPKEAKAFYMDPDPEDKRLVLGVDMLAPEGYGEIIGGGQRTASLEYLDSQIEAHGLPAEAFEWYRDLRKYGSVPHAGFGIGLERFVGWICGTHHVREAIPFPRTMNRLYP